MTLNDLYSLCKQTAAASKSINDEVFDKFTVYSAAYLILGGKRKPEELYNFTGNAASAYLLSRRAVSMLINAYKWDAKIRKSGFLTDGELLDSLQRCVTQAVTTYAKLPPYSSIPIPAIYRAASANAQQRQQIYSISLTNLNKVCSLTHPRSTVLIRSIGEQI